MRKGRAQHRALEVYVTFRNSEEARRICRALVRERLVACANVFPVTSAFRWKGKIVQRKEVSALLKTTEDLFPAIARRVKLLHSYDVPCILAWPMTSGNPRYLSWVQDSTHASR